MWVTDPSSCFELHWYVYSLLSVVLAINKLPIEQKIYFAFESKNSTADHNLTLNDLLYFESEFIVDFNCERNMIDDMILVEFSDVI